MVEAVPSGYADALRREIMRSEQQRMRAVAIILTVLLAATTLAILFNVGVARELFKAKLTPTLPITAIGPFAAYEFLALLILRYRIGHDRDFPIYGRLINALIETSLPSVLIYLLARDMDPRALFGFWPPMLYFVFIVLSILRLDFWLSAWTGAVAAVQQYALAIWLLPLDNADANPMGAHYFYASRSAVLLIAGLVAGAVALRVRRQFENSIANAAARDRIVNLFGQHVSPEVAEQLLAHADPPSEIRTVCVMFLDIRGFTAMTRVRTARETVSLLNEFFGEMVEIAHRHNGIINKFLGDGFLALFGAPIADPNAAADAVKAAQAMLTAIDTWNAAHPARALKVGIGVHIGEAVTGTVGSAMRKEYTVIGDTVNLASRLEQLTKETGARLLVSDAVRRILGEIGTDLGALPIKGYAEPVRVWRLA